MPGILAATDFSERSARAVRRAGMLAQQSGARLVLLHVVGDSPAGERSSDAMDAARLLLGQAAASVPAEVACEQRVAPGPVLEAIERAAVEGAFDLIVMGAHKEQLLRDAIVDPLVERVVRLRAAPVLVVGGQPEGPYESALVGIDLTAHSAYALQRSRELGLLPDTRLAFVHAFDPVAKGKLQFAGVAGDVVSQYVVDTKAAVHADLGTFLDAIGVARESVAMHVIEGRPADAIRRAAARVSADLVVLAANARSGLGKLVLGSVTEEVLRSLDRDILVVPPQPA